MARDEFQGAHDRLGDFLDSIGSTVTAPTPSGTNDAPALNTAIQAVPTGGTFKVPAGSTYKVSTPIIVHSNAVYNFIGATITFTDATIRNNLLVNEAAIPTVTANDASTVVGSSVVTSPTLAAVAQVNQQMAVVGAGPDGGIYQGQAGPIWLYGTVQSVDKAAGTITLGGNVNGVAAHRVVSNATAYLFKRDKNITILGGTWDLNTNWNDHNERYAGAYLTHQMRLRRIDHLTVKGPTVKQVGFAVGGGWCFGTNAGDCTDFLFEDITADGSSTALELEGPLYRGIIRNIRGQSQDDQVALGTVGAAGADLEGDVTDVLIDGVLANGSLRCVTLFAGQGSNGVYRPMNGVSVKGLKGQTMNEPFRVVEYAGNAQMSVEVADVTALPTDYPTHKFWKITNSVAQPGIKVRGPNTGQDLLPPSIVTANQLGIGTGYTATALSQTFDAPPSGTVWVEVFVFSMQQRTVAGTPSLMISDTTGAVVNMLTLYTGSVNTVIDGFTGNFFGRLRVAGLTPSQTYTYKVRAKTTAGTTDFQAGPTSPAILRIITAAP